MGKKKNRGKNKNDPLPKGSGSNKPCKERQDGRPPAATQPQQQPETVDDAAGGASKTVPSQSQEPRPSISSMSESRNLGERPQNEPGPSSDKRGAVQEGSRNVAVPGATYASALSGQIAGARISDISKGRNKPRKGHQDGRPPAAAQPQQQPETVDRTAGGVSKTVPSQSKEPRPSTSSMTELRDQGEHSQNEPGPSSSKRGAVQEGSRSVAVPGATYASALSGQIAGTRISDNSKGSNEPCKGHQDGRPPAATQPQQQPKAADHAAGDASKTVPSQSQEPRPSTSSMSKSRDRGEHPQNEPGPSGDEKGIVQEGSRSVARYAESSKGSYANPFTSLEERRQHCGKDGKSIKLLANHFPIRLKRKSIVLYNVDLTMVQFKRPPRKSDIAVTTRAFVKMVEDNPHIFINPNGIVFDGMKYAYSTQRLKFANDAPSFEANVTVREFPDLDREVEVAITLSVLGDVNIGDIIDEFIRGNEGHDVATQALNIILGMAPRLSFTTINRSFFPPKPGVLVLGQGKSLWVGTFKSVRVGWKLALNVDMANKPGYEKKFVMPFIREFLGRPVFGGNPQIPNENELPGLLKITKNLENVSKELKGLKVRFYRPGGAVRQYAVNKLTTGNSKNLILDVDGVKMSVFDYFDKTFHFKLKFPDLPCIHVGNPSRTIYLPMEMCEIQKQAAPRSKKLTESQAAAMVRQTAIPPNRRKELISKGLKDLMDSYEDNPYTKEFGISIDDRMMNITGRVLEAPTLHYLDNKGTKEGGNVQVNGGSWRMGQRKFTEGKSLASWGVLNLTTLQQGEVEEFVNKLRKEGRNCGLTIDYPRYASGRDERQVVRFFEDLFENIKQEQKQGPQLIMVIGLKKGAVRDLVKHTSDVIYGIPSQYVLQKTVRNINPQILHNICLKLNSKLGGTNQVFAEASLPDVLQEPVMIMGADVTHPAPGERKPSIAAVVGSCDPGAQSLYNTEVSFQFGNQAIEEITKLEEMTRRLLEKFYQKTAKRKPKRIIFYRDGVSEGQFAMVLAKELTAIQKACTSLQKDYEPGITFVIAQKRHKTRFFPQHSHDGIGRGKNIPPGTTVDTDVTHPTETSFYLASHEGIQVTLQNLFALYVPELILYVRERQNQPIIT